MGWGGGVTATGVCAEGGKCSEGCMTPNALQIAESQG